MAASAGRRRRAWRQWRWVGASLPVRRTADIPCTPGSARPMAQNVPGNDSGTRFHPPPLFARAPHGGAPSRPSRSSPSSASSSRTSGSGSTGWSRRRWIARRSPRLVEGTFVEWIERAAGAPGGGALDADSGDQRAIVRGGDFMPRVARWELVDLLLDGSAPTGCGFPTALRVITPSPRRRWASAVQQHRRGRAARHWRAQWIERVPDPRLGHNHGNGTNDVFRAAREVLFVRSTRGRCLPGDVPAMSVWATPPAIR